ncbi:hypothetical protein [Plantibacter sp. YIM 135347]|uniref:PH-like domain-containing protein n=1 Tax=Plantibacter sp. YIM 135347 TaxID=3423919 RepID=UPI003D34AFD8
MDTRIIAALIVAAVLVLALLGMLFAWRKRVKRDSTIAVATPLPDPRPTPIRTATVLYVATSKRDQPIERLALPGLAYRSKVQLEVSAQGLVIDVPGDRPTFVPAAAIASVGQASWTIDRVVERDGLIVLAWSPAPGLDADSYFRVLDQADRSALISSITDITPALRDSRPHNESA